MKPNDVTRDAILKKLYQAHGIGETARRACCSELNGDDDLEMIQLALAAQSDILGEVQEMVELFKADDQQRATGA